MADAAPVPAREVPAHEVPARERGRLDLADRVVEKVATRAASEPAGVVTTAASDRSAVGDAVQRVVRTDLPRAQADVGGGATRLKVTVASRWPSPLPQTTAAVREHVARRVTELTGLRVDGVDVAVTTQVAGAPAAATDLAAPLPAAARPVRSTRVVVLGVVLAVVLGAIGVLAVQSALVEAGWLTTTSWWSDLVTAVGVLSPQDWYVPVGVLVALLGLVLLLASLTPGRRQGLAVGSATGTWMTARDVARYTSGAAEQVDGVLSASTSVRARRVVVTVRTTGPDLASEVKSLVTQRLSVLDPAPSVVVHQRAVRS